MWVRRERQRAAEWQKERDRLSCCGKGHQSPLWGWVVFEPHFCGYNVHSRFLCVGVYLFVCASMLVAGGSVLGLIFNNKELASFGSLAVPSISWETTKKHTQTQFTLSTFGDLRASCIRKKGWESQRQSDRGLKRARDWAEKHFLYRAL